ncbi:MAG: T9SS type A sorting domain-containing protein, partial [Bacteroidales bacterium]|nr:T9SS type A sorting domain-containing protein [Bacteroidales bacterium]
MKKVIILFILFIIQYLPRGIIFYFLFLWGSILNSQDTWLHTYDPFYEAIFSVEDVIVCSDGGYAVNGTCVDQETTIGWGFVMKTDSEGNLLWAKRDTVSFQIENESQAIVETEDGGIISASYLYIGGTAMIKRDTNGIREWANLLENLYVHSMDKTIDNNIIVAGTTTVNNSSTAMIAKLNENGTIIWQNYFEFDNSLWSVIQSISTTSNGNYLLSGRVKYEATEDAALVIKVNSDGDSLWTRIYDSTALDERANTIIEVDESNTIVGGYIENESGFVWKLDSEGNTIWLETGTINCGYEITSFAKSSDGFIISLFGDLVFNNSLRKFDSDYNIEWTNDLPYFSGHGDKALGITSSEHIVVALYNPPYIVLTKLNSDGTDIDDNVINDSRTVLKAYPNPFNPTINFSFTLEENSETEIKIFNIKGELISSIKEDFLNIGENKISWRTDNISSGVYFVQLKVNNKILETKKITLIK